MNVKEVVVRFLNQKAVSVKPLGEGHINDTFLAETEKGKYVVQRVKSSMDIEGCEYNFGLYSGALAGSDWLYPVLIRNKEGKIFFTDETGSHWRMYEYIDGEILNTPVSDEILYSCGKGLAEMHMIFSRIREKPTALYPHLHDLKYYYEIYLQARDGGDHDLKNTDPFIEGYIASKINSMLEVESDRTSVVHGDPKLANILFKNGKVIGFIDFDTVMPGSRLEDLADCVRSCCIEDGVLNREKAEKLVKGYNNSIPGNFAPDMDKLPVIYNKICFELGLRYYIDTLTDGNTFKEKYPGYRLERARSLFSEKIQYKEHK